MEDIIQEMALKIATKLRISGNAYAEILRAERSCRWKQMNSSGSTCPNATPTSVSKPKGKPWRATIPFPRPEPMATKQDPVESQDGANAKSGHFYGAANSLHHIQVILRIRLNCRK